MAKTVFGEEIERYESDIKCCHCGKEVTLYWGKDKTGTPYFFEVDGCCSKGTTEGK